MIQKCLLLLIIINYLFLPGISGKTNEEKLTATGIETELISDDSAGDQGMLVSSPLEHSGFIYSENPAGIAFTGPFILNLFFHAKPALNIYYQKRESAVKTIVFTQNSTLNYKKQFVKLRTLQI